MGDVQRRADEIDPRAQLGAAHQALARAPPLNNSIVAFRNRERTRRIPLVLLRVHVAYVAVLARQTLAIVDPHPEAGGAGHAQVHAHAQFGGGVGAIGVVRAVCFLEGVEPVVVCSADSTERSSARGTERDSEQGSGRSEKPGAGLRELGTFWLPERPFGHRQACLRPGHRRFWGRAKARRWTHRRSDRSGRAGRPSPP